MCGYQINAWFLENRDPETGEYPDFPDDADSGSKIILNPPLLPPPPPPAADGKKGAKKAPEKPKAKGKGKGKSLKLTYCACHSSQGSGKNPHMCKLPEGFVSRCTLQWVTNLGVACDVTAMVSRVTCSGQCKQPPS